MGSQQQFCLRWNNHQSNLLNVFDELLQQETLVDVTLACEGLSMKAHKVVLSACSPYFQHLFADNPCTHPIVILKDVSFTDMRTLVDFMYKGEVNVSHEQLSTLLRVADTLKVKGLAEVTESVTAATAGVTEPEESVPAAPVRTEPAMQYGLSSGGGPVSPPSKRRRRARRLSVGGEDTPDGLGRRSGGPSSRSSTPTELVQHRVFPKTEVIDVSYEDEVMGPERGGGGRASCARMSDGGSNHASAGAGGHPSTSTSSGSGGGGIKRHVGGPSQDDGSLLARISEVPKNFEASSLDADSEMPFTQHLSVVGVESGSPDSGHGLSRLLQQQQQQQRADPGAYYPSTSSLTISEVQGGDGSSMSISDVTGAGPSTAGPSTSRGGGGGSTGGAGGGGVNAQEYLLSERGNKMLLDCGHLYFKDGSHGETVFWKCAKCVKFKCHARVHTHNEAVVKRISEHNHKADEAKVDALRIINEVKLRAALSQDGIQQIVADATVGVSKSAAAKLPSSSGLKRAIQRIRNGEVKFIKNLRSSD